MKFVRRGIAAVVSLSVGAGWTGAVARADAASVLYVNEASQFCTDTGAGTEDAPFCSIQAAADAAVAGDTVRMLDGQYVGAVDVISQGTASAPIVFQAEGAVRIVDATGQSGPSLTFDGASYVTFEGLDGHLPQLAFSSALVSDSSHITIDGARGQTVATTVEVSGTSSSITVSRSRLAGVIIDAGSSDDVVTTNDITVRPSLPGISVTGASETAITSNTLVADYNDDNAIEVAGSSGTSIENNIVEDYNSVFTLFPATAPEAGIAVDAVSAPNTTLDYNVVYVAPAKTATAYTVSPYSWAGTAYASASALYQTTSQGQHDLNADAGLYVTIGSDSDSAPQLNSANASAPGMLVTDIYGYPCQGDGIVPVTGAGSPNYCARGAAQPQYTTTVSTKTTTVGALSVKLNSNITQTMADYGTGTNGTTTQQAVYLTVAPSVSYTINWGDGQTQTVTGSNSGSLGTDTAHTYAAPGTYSITETAALTTGGTTAVTTSSFTTVGSEFVPVAPSRMLDTRHGTGGIQVPLTANVCYVLAVGGVGSIPAGATAVAANLTVTDTAGNGYFFLGSQGGSNSVLNYRTGQTVENAIVAPLASNGGLSICDAGPAGVSADAILDVTGYFTHGTGSGYQPVAEDRLLDTRHGTGAAQAKVAAHSAVPVSVAGLDSIPSGVTAVAVHVTVTDTTGNGWIAAEPDGASVPTTSTLNYLKGQTIANTVIVPVAADGKIELYNGGGTTPVDLIADVSGYFSASAPDAFVPIQATRPWDSRIDGQKLTANSTQTYPLSVDGVPAGASIVANITLTDETANGFVTAYAQGSPRPGTSNLNYFAQRNIGGLSILSTTGSANDVDVYNQSTGSTDIVFDVSGYFADS